jgi:hypothetical protein
MLLRHLIKVPFCILTHFFSFMLSFAYCLLQKYLHFIHSRVNNIYGAHVSCKALSRTLGKFLVCGHGCCSCLIKGSPLVLCSAKDASSFKLSMLLLDNELSLIYLTILSEKCRCWLVAWGRCSAHIY